jgi:Tol biopolymer transport system component
MSERLDAYIARQAATVGRRARQVTRPVWVPQLPSAQGMCLGKLEVRSPSTGSLPSLALSADGRSLVTGHSDGVIRRWDLTTGTVVWATQSGHTDGVPHVALSPDQTCLASASYDRSVRLWDAASGNELRRLDGHSDQVYRVSWAPYGRQLASAGDDRTIRLWDAATGQLVRVLQGHTGQIHGLAWSPDGQSLASSSYDKTIRLWDAVTGTAHPPLQKHDQRGSYVTWSPDGRQLLAGYEDGTLLVVDVAHSSTVRHWKIGNDWAIAHSWSPDGRFVAAVGRNETFIRVWDAQTGTEVARFDGDEPTPYLLVWSTDCGFLAVSHYRNQRDVVCFWDTRALWPAVAPARAPDTTPEPLLAALVPLPTALAQLHRLGHSAPLALVRDLLALTGGRAVDGPLASLASEPGLVALAALRWPAPTRIGLVALLLHQLPLADWQPPAGVSPTQVRDALAAALQGEEIPPEAPAPPVALLRDAAQRIDDRLLALLTMLGPDAVAADPGLPLRLLPRVGTLLALSASQRRLLGVRVRFSERGGQASGRSPGADRALVGGVESGRLRTDWGSLLPSQLALDTQLLAYRYARGELLFRAREVAEPPKLRPTVLLLDTSPPTFGPIEAITRLAAFVVARTLHEARVPVVLITSGDKGEQVLALEHTADLIEVWTQRTLQPLDTVRALRLASAVRATLRDEGGLEPVVLLLTQPWCGAEATVPALAGLRGLFVQYPGQQMRPALAGQCERWQSVAAGQTSGLAHILGQLLG